MDLSFALKNKELQVDTFCKCIITMLKDNKIQNGHPYFLNDDVLMRYVAGNTQTMWDILLCHLVSIATY